MMFCCQIKIYGRTQGVFFRHFARQEAKKFGLSGWAKNLPDGSVEIVACGDKEKINEFIKWCCQGPELAKVEKVDSVEIPFQKFKNFRVL